MPEKSLSKDDLLQDWKDAFDQLDKDGDGHISTKDLALVLTSFGQSPSEAELTRMINELDSNGDGRLDFPEFLAIMYKKRDEKYSADAEIREAFSVFDRDSSGYITGKEILEVMENLGETVTLAEVQEMVRAADTDGDGRISFADFEAVMRNANV